MIHDTRSLIAGAFLSALSLSASASNGVTVENMLLTLLAVGGAFWLAFAFIAPFRRSMLRIPRNANHIGLFIFAAVALAYAAVSVVLGKTWLGAGVVLQAVEPARFWLFVKFEAGVGCALLFLGLLTPRRSR